MVEAAILRLSSRTGISDYVESVRDNNAENLANKQAVEAFNGSVVEVQFDCSVYIPQSKSENQNEVKDKPLKQRLLTSTDLIIDTDSDKQFSFRLGHDFIFPALENCVYDLLINKLNKDKFLIFFPGTMGFEQMVGNLRSEKRAFNMRTDRDFLSNKANLSTSHSSKCHDHNHVHGKKSHCSFGSGSNNTEKINLDIDNLQLTHDVGLEIDLEVINVLPPTFENKEYWQLSLDDRLARAIIDQKNGTSILKAVLQSYTTEDIDISNERLNLAMTYFENAMVFIDSIISKLSTERLKSFIVKKSSKLAEVLSYIPEFKDSASEGVKEINVDISHLKTILFSIQSNHSLCLLKLKRYEPCIAECIKLLDNGKYNHKIILRLSYARRMINRDLDDSLEDINNLIIQLKTVPENSEFDTQKKLQVMKDVEREKRELLILIKMESKKESAMFSKMFE